MPNTSDELQKNTSNLSKVGKCLLNAREQIISLWHKRLRAEISAVSDLLHPVIIDTIPVFLVNLAEALTPSYPRSTASEMSTIAKEHGAERARLTKYNIEQLVIEYQILRTAIFEEMDKKCALSAKERNVINNSIDVAVREAITSFALTQANIREQFVATLTHDIRNPLNAAMMATELIRIEPSNVEVIYPNLVDAKN